MTEQDWDPRKPIFVKKDRWGEDEESCWTISQDPNKTGWETDSGHCRYGLTKATAMRIASLWNAAI